jgi:hypothetical protein
LGSENDATKGHRIRIPDVVWLAYGRVCKEVLGTNRTARLLDHMRKDINRYGSEEDINAVARGDVELAERRARMSPGRPPKSES